MPALFTSTSIPPSSSSACARERLDAVEIGEVDDPHPRLRRVLAHAVEHVGAAGPRARAQMPTIAPRCREAFGERGADARRRSGDQHVLAGQVVGHARQPGRRGSLPRPCRSTPRLRRCSTGSASRSSPAPRSGSARRSRSRSRDFGAHVAICDRDATNLARPPAQIEALGRRVVTARARRPRARQVAACHDVDRRVRPRRRAGEQRGRRLPRRVRST